MCGRGVFFRDKGRQKPTTTCQHERRRQQREKDVSESRAHIMNRMLSKARPVFACNHCSARANVVKVDVRFVERGCFSALCVQCDGLYHGNASTSCSHKRELWYAGCWHPTTGHEILAEPNSTSWTTRRATVVFPNMDCPQCGKHSWERDSTAAGCALLALYMVDGVRIFEAMVFRCRFCDYQWD